MGWSHRSRLLPTPRISTVAPIRSFLAPGDPGGAGQFTWAPAPVSPQYDAPHRDATGAPRTTPGRSLSHVELVRLPTMGVEFTK